MINDHEGILQRLEKLERQNRRMKLAGLGAIVIAGAFLLTGQASGPRTQDEVRAKGFILVDTSGEARARLFMSSDGPSFQLYDANGKPRLNLVELSYGSQFAMYNEDGKQEVTLVAFASGPLFNMIGESGKSGIALTAISGQPGIGLGDANGFETDLGVTDLITLATGEKHKTSAASIVLLGKDKTVLWSAPPQN